MPVEQLIYTDRPRGKGVDPNAAGYQVAACSPGLDAEARDLLAGICRNYGQVVRENAPAAARQAEDAWRIKTERLDAVPEDVLREFPVIWSYDRLRDGLYALTRVCYTGLTHDGRVGNFLAHSLAFAPEALAACGGSPLALAGSKLFQDKDPGGDSLDALAESALAAAGGLAGGLLAGAPYAERLEPMIAALAAATPAHRPVVICLSDWRQAASVVLELLGALPPSARSRTTLCTFEGDRTWVPTTRGARPAGVAAAHHLLVLCGEEDRAFNLRSDEYENTYAVFNFVGGKTSSVSVSAYAVFAAGCLKAGKRDRLAAFHGLIEKLGAGQRPEARDALVPAACLLEGAPAPDAMAAGFRALAGQATSPEAARPAVAAALPHLKTAAAAGADALAPLVADLAALAERLPDEGDADCTGFFTAVQALAGAELAVGRYRAADLLLQACGSARRDRLALALLRDAVAQPNGLRDAAAPEDREPLVKLLMNAVQAAEKDAGAAALLPALLAATFRAAAAAGQAAQTWAALGGAVVKPKLEGEWNPEKDALAGALQPALPADHYPEASLWLERLLLDARKPQGEALLAALVRIARAGSRLGEGPRVLSEVLAKVEGMVADEDQRPVVLGRLADAVYGTPSWAVAFARYRDGLKQVPANRLPDVRKKLLDAGAARLLCREFAEETLPAGEQEGSVALEKWRPALAASPELLGLACQEVAGALGAGLKEPASSVARALLTRQAGRPGGPGFIALYAAAVKAQSVGPLAPVWEKVLLPAPEGVPPEVAARLRVLQFLGVVKRKRSEADWGTNAFPRAETAWTRDLRNLDPRDRDQVIEWCMGTFDEVGIPLPQDAQGLVAMLDAAGQAFPQAAAQAAAHLARGRDPVTVVQVLTAFARCETEGAVQGNWAEIVRILLASCDVQTRRLFDEHLQHRFSRTDDRTQQRVKALRVHVGLAAPEAESPAKVVPKQPVAGPAPAAGGGSLIDTLRRIVGSLLGPGEPPIKPGAGKPNVPPTGQQPPAGQEPSAGRPPKGPGNPPAGGGGTGKSQPPKGKKRR